MLNIKKFFLAVGSDVKSLILCEMFQNFKKFHTQKILKQNKFHKALIKITQHKFVTPLELLKI
jgi:hypothetical protein